MFDDDVFHSRLTLPIFPSRDAIPPERLKAVVDRTEILMTVLRSPGWLYPVAVNDEWRMVGSVGGYGSWEFVYPQRRYPSGSEFYVPAGISFPRKFLSSAARSKLEDYGILPWPLAVESLIRAMIAAVELGVVPPELCASTPAPATIFAMLSHWWTAVSGRPSGAQDVR